MKLTFLMMILISTPALAQKATVLIVDPDVDASGLEKNYHIQRPAQHYGLPPKQVRDEVLMGIDSVKSYDELKKDMLYMDLHSKKLKDLKSKYPEISETEFKLMLGRR